MEPVVSESSARCAMAAAELTLDTSGRIISLPPAGGKPLQALSGLQSGSPLQPLLHEDDQASLAVALSRLAFGELREASLLLRFVGADGWEPVLATLHGPVAPNGSVTVRLTPAGEGAPATQELMAIIESALTAVLVHRDGKPLFVNQTYARLMGYASAQEAMEKHVLGCRVHPEERPIVESRAKARQAGQDVPWHYEVRLCRPDDTTIWVDCFASRITWNGEPALLAMYYDVTARKRAEEALQRSERLFSTLFQFSPDPLILTTLEDGVVRDVNAAVCELFKLPREELIGRSVADIGLWADPTRRVRLVEELKRVGKVRDVVNSFRSPWGTVHEFQVSCELLQINGEQLILSVGRDVTERRRAEARIAHMAHHDALTGLANRTLFQQRLEQELHDDRLFGVLCLDLDRFKGVNDRLGHPFGDAVLCAVAARLQSCVRETDTVARLGGDEFAVIQAAGDQPRAAQLLADRLVERLGQPFSVDGTHVLVGASVGIAVAPRDGTSPADLLKAADIALYEAKTAGRGTSRAFHIDMGSAAQSRRQVEIELRRALGQEEFELHFQPLIDLRSRKPAGFEALLRWKNPARGLVLPADFVPVAEETGLLVPIGAWVLRDACAEAAAWPEPLKVSVNVSPAQLRSGGLVEEVHAALAASGLRPGRLELDVAESTLFGDPERVLGVLRSIREMGVAVALDDFGTGYSSLGHLVRLPFDRVKIDRSFVAGIGQRSDCEAVVRAVSGLCRRLDVATTAEGVETESQLRFIEAEGVQEAQGLLFSPARPAADIAYLVSADDLVRRSTAEVVTTAAASMLPALEVPVS